MENTVARLFLHHRTSQQTYLTAQNAHADLTRQNFGASAAGLVRLNLQPQTKATALKRRKANARGTHKQVVTGRNHTSNLVRRSTLTGSDEDQGLHDGIVDSVTQKWCRRELHVSRHPTSLAQTKIMADDSENCTGLSILWPSTLDDKDVLISYRGLCIVANTLFRISNQGPTTYFIYSFPYSLTEYGFGSCGGGLSPLRPV